MKRLTAISLLLINMSTFAGVYIGNNLYEPGEATLNEVEKAMNIDENSREEYRVRSTGTDIVHVYHTESGMTDDMVFIDGVLSTVDSNRQ